MPTLPGDGRERDNPEEDQGPSQGRGWFPFCFFSKSSFSYDFFLILLSYALKVPICFGHNVKQEEKLSDFRMDVMEVEI